MNKRLLLPYVAILFCFFVANLYSQDTNLILKFKDGTTSQAKIQTIKNLTFPNGKTMLLLRNGTGTLFSNSEIQRLYFETTIDDVPLVNEAANMLVYPNPTTGIVSFRGFDGESLAVRFYNLSGMLVFSASISSLVHSVNIDFLPKGIYLVNVNGQQSKLIKL